MFPLPHVCESTPVPCATYSVVPHRDLHGSRNECMAAANLVQRLEACLLDLWRELDPIEYLSTKSVGTKVN